MKRLHVGLVAAVGAILFAAGPVTATPLPAPTVEVRPESTPAAAAGTPGLRRGRPERWPGPCAEDIRRFCAGVAGGRGRHRACLLEHEAELSQACREHLRSRMERRQGGRGRWRIACADELRRLCADVRPMRRELHACLLRHEAQLGAECRAALQGAGPEQRGRGRGPGGGSGRPPVP